MFFVTMFSQLQTGKVTVSRKRAETARGVSHSPYGHSPLRGRLQPVEGEDGGSAGRDVLRHLVGADWGREEHRQHCRLRLRTPFMT